MNGLVFFNATLEEFTWMCNSSKYRFTPRGKQIIPYEVSSIAKDELAMYGVYCLTEAKTERERVQQERTALTNYIKFTLIPRLKNFEGHFRDRKEQNIEINLNEFPLYTRSQRWKKELEEKLRQESPIDVELSYLTADERKTAGISGGDYFHPDSEEDQRRLKEFVDKGLIPQNIFEGFENAKVQTIQAPDLDSMGLGADILTDDSFDGLELDFPTTPKRTRAKAAAQASV